MKRLSRFPSPRAVDYSHAVIPEGGTDVYVDNTVNGLPYEGVEKRQQLGTRFPVGFGNAQDCLHDRAHQQKCSRICSLSQSTT